MHIFFGILVLLFSGFEFHGGSVCAGELSIAELHARYMPSPESEGFCAPAKRLAEKDAATTVSSAKFVVRGRVTLDDGKAATTATVLTLKSFDYSGGNPKESILAQGNVNSAGYYELGTEIEAPYCIVTISSPGRAEMKEYVQLGRAAAVGGRKITVKDVVLKRAAPIRGVAIDLQNQPAGNVKLSLDQGNSSAETTTTASGQFAFESAAPGEGAIVVNSPDYVYLKKTVVAPDSNLTITLNSGGASIEGGVFTRGGGEGVANAEVSIFVPDNSGGFPRARAFDSRTTKTSSQGLFSFAHLPADKYNLGVQAEHYALCAVKGGWPSIKVRDGESTSGIVLQVFPGNTVGGTVVDKKTSTPLSGVLISNFAYPHGVKTSTSEAYSSSDGSYRVTGIGVGQSPGTGIVGVSKKGYTLADAKSGYSNVEVKLNPDKDELPLDIKMEPTVTVSGKITTQDGSAVSSATVTFIPAITETSKVESDAAGHYEFETAARSQVLMKAEKEGFPTTYTKPIDLRESTGTQMNIVFTPGGRIQGSVEDWQGQPVPDADVSLYFKEPDQFRQMGSGSGINTKTKSLGEFEFNDVPGQLVTLNAGKSGAGPSKTLALNMKSGETTSGVRLVLSQPHSIAGKIVANGNKPVSGANVYAYSRNGGARGVTSDADGKFRVEDLTSGTYTLSVNSTEFGDGTKSNVPVDKDDVVVELKSKGKVTITGKVVDGKTNQPVADFSVVESNMGRPGGDVEKSEDTPGQFKVENVQAGAYLNFTVSADGYIDTPTGYFQVPTGQETFEKVIKLSKGGTVTGRVVGKANNEPLAGVQINISNTGRGNTGNPTNTSSDADGRFRLEGINTGNNTVEFHPDAPYSAYSVDLIVESETTLDVGDIVLNSGSSVHGKVILLPGSSGVSGTTVQVTSVNAADRKPHEVQTDSDGKFEFTGLSNGYYTATVPAYQGSWRIMVEANDNKEIMLRVGGARLHGVVRKQGNGIQSSIQMTLGNYGAAQSIQFVTDENGKYEYKDVGPGKWLASIGAGTNNQTSNFMVNVTVEEKDDQEQNFDVPSARIVGTVENEGGTKLPDITVAAVSVNSATSWNDVLPGNYGGGPGVQTQGDGSFAIEGVETGTYSVKAKGPNNTTAQVDNVIVPITGDTAPIALVLKKVDGGSLESTALNMTTGGPIKDAWCILWNGTVKFNNTSVRGDDGVMTIPDIPPATYRVQVSSFGFSIAEHQVQIEAGKTATLRDVLYEAGAIRLSVTDKNGSGQAGVSCTVTPDDHNSIETVRTGVTDKSGLWVVRGLFPGNYTATAADSKGNIITGKTSVQAHQPIDVVLKID